MDVRRFKLTAIVGLSEVITHVYVLNIFNILNISQYLGTIYWGINIEKLNILNMYWEYWQGFFNTEYTSACTVKGLQRPG